MSFAPTKQQQTITDYFKASVQENKLTSFFINAAAGSGKTSTIMLQMKTIMELERELKRALTACTVSFNTNIRDASTKKLTDMGSTVKAKTTNQLGRAILAAAAKDGLCKAPGKLDSKKYDAIVEDLMIGEANNRRYFTKYKDFVNAMKAVVALVDAVRSTRVEPTEENLLNIISHYNLHEKIDIVSPAWPLIVDMVELAIMEGVNQYQKTGLHDFNDQICLPLQLDLAAPTWDVIFIDEAQDLNRARLEMITKVIKPNGVLFFVGDPRQAIQGFTYADTDSVGTIKTVTNAIELPLSVCWRCDEKIIRLARVLTESIEAYPGSGKETVKFQTNSVESVDADCLTVMLEPGYKKGSEEKDADLVLCRVKAPLVQKCLETIRAGKSAIVRGRDIGRGIVSFLDEILPCDFKNLEAAIDENSSKKIDKLFGKKDAEAKIAEILDRSDTLKALLDGYLYTLASVYMADIDSFKIFINSKFADDETSEEAAKDRVKPIVFSTIHKAKGLEYDRVFILEPSLLPHPAAKAGWQREQEENIIYVAVTRAKHALIFVGGVPDILFSEYTAIKNEEEGITEVIEIEGIDEQEETEIELEAASAIEIAEEIIAEAPKKRGRPATGRIRKQKQYSLSQEMIDVLKAMASTQGKTESELLEEIFFKSIQQPVE